MADVARLAGVSHQTVSRVINGQSNLRPETRERVLQAIKQLGYRPNSAARALVTRRSATIGVIGSKGGYWGPSTVHRTIQAAGRQAGYFVSSTNLQQLTREELTDAIEPPARPERRGHRADLGDRRRARGGPGPGAHRECPWSWSRATRPRPAGPSGSTRSRGAELGTRHLIDLGHTEILHLAGPQDWTEARARLLGWQTSMYAAGLRPSPHVIGDWSAASGYEAGLEIARRDDVTAVFCANDQMALGLLRALSEAGRSVPQRRQRRRASTTSRRRRTSSRR